MKELIEKIKLKADSIPTNTDVNRNVKGAYVDCLIMAKEANKNFAQPDVDANNVIGVVYCVFDDGNYYSVPQTIRIFNTEEKAIEFCKSKPFEKYWWGEMEVE
jgi:hypothetical protein